MVSQVTITSPTNFYTVKYHSTIFSFDDLEFFLKNSCLCWKEIYKCSEKEFLKF